jgi:hypothetical protein
MERPHKLPELGWYREIAERAANTAIWDARGWLRILNSKLNALIALTVRGARGTAGLAN